MQPPDALIVQFQKYMEHGSRNMHTDAEDNEATIEMISKEVREEISLHFLHLHLLFAPAGYVAPVKPTQFAR